MSQIHKILALVTLLALGAIGAAPKAFACGGPYNFQPSAEQIEMERVQSAVITFFRTRRAPRELVQFDTVEVSGQSARVSVRFQVPGRRIPRAQVIELAQRDGQWTVIGSTRPRLAHA